MNPSAGPGMVQRMVALLQHVTTHIFTSYEILFSDFGVLNQQFLVCRKIIVSLKVCSMWKHAIGVKKYYFNLPHLFGIIEKLEFIILESGLRVVKILETQICQMYERILVDYISCCIYVL